MDGVNRPRPPCLSRETTRHGRAVWYVRRHGRRIRIHAAFGTAEFEIEYQNAIAGRVVPKPAKGEAATGTLAWLIARYRETTAWTTLSLATRRQREHIFRQILENAGTQPLARITSDAIMAGRERRSATPSQARHFLDAMRGLFRWALAAKHVRSDPTAGVDDPPRARTGGFPPWTEDDIAAYERRWPSQLEAIFGWSGGRMASLYTRNADRRRLSLEAMHKLENEKPTSIVARKGKVRQRPEKPK